MADLLALAYGLLVPALYVTALAALAGLTVVGQTRRQRACYSACAIGLLALPTLTGWGI